MSVDTTTRPVILTGDRTTGPLHLGHLVGSFADSDWRTGNHGWLVGKQSVAGNGSAQMAQQIAN